ncbi:MAG: radical SAM protein [Fibrobacteria bacterium]|nr:radical SAM protein [Fibrobacteria bacterium]
MAGAGEEVAEAVLHGTMAWCESCATTEPARLVARPDGVHMERLCPVQGVRATRVAARAEWYMRRVPGPREADEPVRPAPATRGCPRDCGPCENHLARIRLPVFSITNDCNMDCPICFTYNRPDRKYYKPIEDVLTIVDKVLERTEGLQLVNMTGGEPTLHPLLPEIVQAVRDRGIPRVTVNTNGLRLASDPEFARRIKESGAHLVLSLDTFDPERSRRIHGADVVAAKRKALEVMERLDIPTTILCVAIQGVNDDEVGPLVSEYLPKEFVRSITIQNMTWTGANGSRFEPRRHITIDEVEDLVAAREGFDREDFFPLAGYHPLCYSVAYYLVHEGKVRSLTRFLAPAQLEALTRSRYFLEPDAAFTRDFLDGLARVWSQGEDPSFLSTLRRAVLALQNPDIDARRRQELAERFVKMVYIHPHMDPDNFDIDRVSRCGDVVPDEEGRMVPACSYNLLYRQRDPRFWVEPS